MVIRFNPQPRRGALATECVVALGILATVMLPMSFTLIQESKLLRAYYFKAAAMEIVDGEMEILAAGEWRALAQGKQSYSVRAASATNLPPGEFVLTVTPALARLEWIPKAHGVGGPVGREVKRK
jgi:hypothetical protein